MPTKTELEVMLEAANEKLKKLNFIDISPIEERYCSADGCLEKAEYHVDMWDQELDLCSPHESEFRCIMSSAGLYG